ncbi:MAG: YdcH family protein [Sulfuricurvum sp.]
MLHEFRDIITQMKEDGAANAHFLKIFDKHNELDDQITKAENGELPLTDMEIEKLKKEKLLLKDEAYAMIIQYKKEHNL